jgi:hypothetical protein
MEKDERLPQTADGNAKLMVYQILSTGSQTMAPPSIHPDLNKPLTWVDRQPPFTLTVEEMVRRGGIEAFLLVVRYFWPARGTRNEAAMALAGVLLRAYGTAVDTDLIDDLVEAVAAAGGDGDRSRKGKRRAAAQLERLEAGDETVGMPRLLELLELPEELAKTFRKWLRLSVHATAGAVTFEDFYAYMPKHTYIFTPTGEHWPVTSVNARLAPVQVSVDEEGKPIKLKASTWLDQNRPVEQQTWFPGQPLVIKDQLVNEGGLFSSVGKNCFNLYRPPTPAPGDASQVKPWLKHVFKLYPGAVGKHIIRWLAHRVQRPDDHINHALVLGSNEHGIGKDTLLEPVKRAIGDWNYYVISPQDMMADFRPFLKSVILLVSEVRDLGEFTRYTFYDHMKSIIAVPPDTIMVNEKFVGQYRIFNFLGIIYTTNHKTDGLYLPSEDRRHYVAWSERKKADFDENYWNEIWAWYDHGGAAHVMAFLMQLNPAKFNAKAPPPKTDAFWAIVNANRPLEDAKLADVLDKMKSPPAITLSWLRSNADGDFQKWPSDPKNSRAIPHRLETCGYVQVHNSDSERGYWTIDSRRQVVYAKATLPLNEQLAAAEALKRNGIPM